MSEDCPPSEPSRRETARRTGPRRTPRRPVIIRDYAEGLYLVEYNDHGKKWQSAAELKSRYPSVGKRLVSRFDAETCYYVCSIRPTPVLRGKRQGYRFLCADHLTLGGRPDTKRGHVWSSPVIELPELPEQVRTWVEATNGVVAPWQVMAEDLITDLDFVLCPRLRGTHPRYEVVHYRDVAGVSAKCPIGPLGDFAYLVKFANGRPDEWLSASHLDFVPKDEAIPTVTSAGITVVEDDCVDPRPALPTMSPGLSTEQDLEDWNVFQRYNLGDLRIKLQTGWRYKPSRTGVVSHALRCFCPMAAYRRLLEGRGVVSKSAGSGILTHRFPPSEVPEILVGVSSQGKKEDDGSGWGPATQAWWRVVFSNNDAIVPGDTDATEEIGYPERTLWAIRSEVMFHWSPQLLRMSVSFRYLHSVKSGPPRPKLWISRHGGEVPPELMK